MNYDDVNTLLLMKMQLTIHFLWQQFSKIRTDLYIILKCHDSLLDNVIFSIFYYIS